MDSAVISDPLRNMVTATRQEDGRIVVRAGKHFMLFSVDEIDRLARFATNEPQLGRLERFPVQTHSDT